MLLCAPTDVQEEEGGAQSDLAKVGKGQEGKQAGWREHEKIQEKETGSWHVDGVLSDHYPNLGEG